MKICRDFLLSFNREVFDLLNIDGRDKRPIYQQIIDKVVLLVGTGVWEEGEKLPSIRSLAQDLGVNANTVARAYTELEYRGIIVTVPKSGTFVAKVDLATEVEADARKEIENVFNKYISLGISKEKLEGISMEVLKHA